MQRPPCPMVATVIRSEAATEPPLPSAEAETKKGIVTDPAALLISLLRETLASTVLLFQLGFRTSGLNWLLRVSVVLHARLLFSGICLRNST